MSGRRRRNSFPHSLVTHHHCSSLSLSGIDSSARSQSAPSRSTLRTSNRGKDERLAAGLPYPADQMFIDVHHPHRLNSSSELVTSSALAATPAVLRRCRGPLLCWLSCRATPHEAGCERAACRTSQLLVTRQHCASIAAAATCRQKAQDASPRQERSAHLQGSKAEDARDLHAHHPGLRC